MSYKIYADEWLLHDDRLDDYQLQTATLDNELNKTGSFEFVIYPDHVYYSKIVILKTIITVYQDDVLLFRGRAFDEEIGFYNERQVACEGELAFLLDSVQRPHEFTGSTAEYVAYLITNHNDQVETAKQFAIGSITGSTISTWEITEHASTWDVIEAVRQNHGGYYQIRHENGENIFDYVATLTKLSPQKIEFGSNLISLNKIRKSDGIATAFIPLGAKLRDDEDQETDERLTIESVNDGLDYIYDQAAVDQFGWIFEVQTYDEITDAAQLLQTGQAHLAAVKSGVETIELSAADLAKAGVDVETFRIGTKVQVISKPHNIDTLFTVNKISLSLFDPASNTLTLDSTRRGFSDVIQTISGEQRTISQKIEKVAKNAEIAVYNVERNLEASIDVAADNITQTVSDRFYLKGETDSKISEVSSSIEQTAKGFTMKFDQFNADLSDLKDGTAAEFDLIRKYIRFIDGSILLGEVGNELELQISNDRISFMQGGAEVAYFSNNRLYVTDGQFIHTLQLGDFAFMPRDNGNLSFKRIV